MRGLSFRVGPDAFFQVNTPAAEVLLEVAEDLAALGPRTTLLDVCCGTGTIGLCMAAVRTPGFTSCWDKEFLERPTSGTRSLPFFASTTSLSVVAARAARGTTSRPPHCSRPAGARRGKVAPSRKFRLPQNGTMRRQTRALPEDRSCLRGFDKPKEVARCRSRVW